MALANASMLLVSPARNFLSPGVPTSRLSGESLSVGATAPPSAATSPSSAPYSCGLALVATAACAAYFRRGRAAGRQPLSKKLRSLPEEDSVRSAINQAPSNMRSDIARVSKTLEMLPEAKDVAKQQKGDWEVIWDSNYGTKRQKTTLKFATDGIMPPVLIEFYGSFQRITDKTYEWIQAFTMDGWERTDAALVWSGSIGKGKGGKIDVKIDSIRLVPALTSTRESRDMLESAGIGRWLKSQKLKSAISTHVEVSHISDGMMVQTDEAGTVFVMKRNTTSTSIPFKME
eukprot:TRINITY_DN121728_c0_g1_i1.p1 TRINITY_DN121728_c0_g1~~TRINITY_DN121728_c0_g1_i1.p1  ORF type:complete len:330 (+),score=77.65 TRINITY_DN121728_c0_g1_i1:127-990(+)